MKIQECQRCGSTRFKPISSTEKQCVYCGSMYSVEKMEPVVIKEDNNSTHSASGCGWCITEDDNYFTKSYVNGISVPFYSNNKIITRKAVPPKDYFNDFREFFHISGFRRK